MEDCGVIITGDDIRILTNMANMTLRYLTLFPRALGSDPNFLPGPEEHYITPDALDAILVCRESHPQLTIFLKSEYADTSMIVDPEYGTSSGCFDSGASAGVAVNHNVEGKRDFNRFVRLGHIAAFRMYDETHLLPLSYFDESN